VLAVVAIGLISVLAGCGRPAGIDGDLTGGWRPMPEPVGWVPAAGACHTGDYQVTGLMMAYHPVDCQLGHATETAHVGEFTGEVADRVTPPPEGSPEWREAYAACDQAATDYLGADFRHGMLWLGVTVPSVAAWEGGARWFRCELAPFDPHAGTFEERLGSLAGALEAESELRLGCYQAVTSGEDSDVEEMRPRDCDEPHNSEFVGVWRAPDVPYPDRAEEDSARLVHDGCLELVAEYADVPVDGDLEFRSGTIGFWMSEEEWDNGDRGLRCYLWLERELTESVRGAGTGGLPVR
jgi:hypothetical protein